MDDDSFKTELLTRLDKIQALLTYLCGAAKAGAERAQAEAALKKRSDPEPGGPEPADKLETPVRSLIQEEMQDGYDQAVERWKSGKT